MKDISNKEIIDRLIEYFLTQDPKIVARALAHAMIDFNRLENFEILPHEERENLLWRLGLNSKEFKRFIRDGHDSDLKLFNMPSD